MSQRVLATRWVNGRCLYAVVYVPGFGPLGVRASREGGRWHVRPCAWMPDGAMRGLMRDAYPEAVAMGLARKPLDQYVAAAMARRSRAADERLARGLQQRCVPESLPPVRAMLRGMAGGGR